MAILFIVLIILGACVWEEGFDVQFTHPYASLILMTIGIIMVLGGFGGAIVYA